MAGARRGRWFMKYEEPNIQILVVDQKDFVRTSLDSGYDMPGTDEDTGEW